jgi:hypothetical protein
MKQGSQFIFFQGGGINEKCQQYAEYDADGYTDKGQPNGSVEKYSVKFIIGKEFKVIGDAYPTAALSKSKQIEVGKTVHQVVQGGVDIEHDKKEKGGYQHKENERAVVFHTIILYSWLILKKSMHINGESG